MNALIPDQAELELMSDAAKASEAVAAELVSVSMLEMIQIRATTITPVMVEILKLRQSSHWGINE